MLTEDQAREMRLDKIEFPTLEDAIKFGTENQLQIRSIYKYSDSIYKILRFSKTGAKKMGLFINGKYVPKELNNPVDNIMNDFKRIRRNRKEIDSQKVIKYFEDHPNINKYSIGPKIYRSKSFINDAIRSSSALIVAWDACCDLLEVPRDYFDPDPEPVVEEPQEVEESEDINYDYNNIHDDLIVLIASNKRIEALLLKLIDIWRSDDDDK